MTKRISKQCVFIHQFTNEEIVEIVKNPYNYTEDDINELFAYFRWGDKVKSAFDNTTKVYKMKYDIRPKYKCSSTQFEFSVITNTIFHRTKLKYNTILLALREYYHGEKRIPALTQTLECGQDTVRRFLSRLSNIEASIPQEDKKNFISFCRYIFNFKIEKYVITTDFEIEKEYNKRQKCKIVSKEPFNDVTTPTTRLEDVRNTLIKMLEVKSVFIPIDLVEEYNELLKPHSKKKNWFTCIIDKFR